MSIFANLHMRLLELMTRILRAFSFRNLKCLERVGKLLQFQEVLKRFSSDNNSVCVPYMNTLAHCCVQVELLVSQCIIFNRINMVEKLKSTILCFLPLKCIP